MPTHGLVRAMEALEDPGPRPQPRDDPGVASDLRARAEAGCHSPCSLRSLVLTAGL